MSKERVKVALYVPEGGLARTMIMGFNQIAAARGWLLEFWAAFPEAPAEARATADLLVAEGYAAVVAGSASPGLAHVDRRRLHLVGMNADLSDLGAPCAVPDDTAIGAEAAGHLLENGFRTFAAFGFPAPWWTPRLAGFRAAVAAAGAAYAPGGEDADALTPKGAPLISPTEIRRWLTSLPRPLGLFAGCDMWGRTLLRFCTEFGLQVPDDVALIGVDDDEVICETAFPTLSSVRVPWRRVGLEAAHLLHQLLEGGPPPSTVRVPPTGVHARRSSDGIAVTDPDVAAALRFIHANAHRRVSVPEILRHVPVGRHTLQRGFRRVLGRTILAEVRRVRVAAARQLLVSTSLSVEEIASLSGFPSADKFGKAFRAETGVTPSAYRLRHAPRGSR